MVLKSHVNGMSYTLFMRMIKTLHIGGPLEYSLGGPPEAFLGTLFCLQKTGLIPSVLVVAVKNAREQSRLQEIYDSGITCQVLSVNQTLSRYQFSLRLPAKLIKMAKENEVIVVHGFYTFSLFCAVRLKRFHKRAVYVMPHGSLEPYQGRRHKFRKKIFRFFLGRFTKIESFLVATSQEELAIKQNKWFHGRLNVVGIPVHSKYPVLQKKISETYLLFLGRISPKKRIDLCIEAMHLLSSENDDLILKIAGVGDIQLTNDLKIQVKNLGLSARIQFLGQVSGQEKWTLIANAQALVLPSENENFAVSVAESLIVGTPVVASIWVALSQTISMYRAGEVILNLSAQELADCIRRVLLDREVYALNAQKTASEFTFEKIGQNWKELLND
jgi:glycosyltransferase involved in cell wall biosynthesis